MTKALKFFAALLIAFPVFAQVQSTYSQPELDQMLAPIALYSDPLLSQVLMAATYPVDVIEAARWSRANPGLQGDDAVRAAQGEDWDPSVKSLLAFPQLLARMDGNLDWTRRLGDAFLGQEPQVMNTVQQLRRRAQAAGNLRSSEQMYVQQQGQNIMLQPAAPQYAYVPYYDPLVVYGPWWWPAYRPVYWAPWPRQSGVRISSGFFFGNFDWHRRQVRVVHPAAYYYRPAFAEQRQARLRQAAPMRVQPAARLQAATQVPARPHVQPQARIPAAVAPQQSRAQHQELRREKHGEPRIEHRHKGKERS